MIIKSLPAVLMLALLGCSSHARKPPEPAPKTELVTPKSKLEIPIDSWRYRIVEILEEEWIYFSQQKIVIEQDEESIPHVGIWEDDDFGHSERVNNYWRAVGLSKLSGNDCQEPWSAAFISWVMQQAKVPEFLFPPAASHRDYLSYIIAKAENPDAVFLPHTIQEYQPKPGDLICANRGAGYFGDVVNEIPNNLNAKLHCDIVVQNDGHTLQAIGGNVRNSVSKSILTLSQDGHLQLSHHRPWFLVVENRLE